MNLFLAFFGPFSRNGKIDILLLIKYAPIYLRRNFYPCLSLLGIGVVTEVLAPPLHWIFIALNIPFTLFLTLSIRAWWDFHRE